MRPYHQLLRHILETGAVVPQQSEHTARHHDVQVRVAIKIDERNRTRQWRRGQTVRLAWTRPCEPVDGGVLKDDVGLGSVHKIGLGSS